MSPKRGEGGAGRGEFPFRQPVDRPSLLSLEGVLRRAAARNHSRCRRKLRIPIDPADGEEGGERRGRVRRGSRGGEEWVAPATPPTLSWLCLTMQVIYAAWRVHNSITGLFIN